MRRIDDDDDRERRLARRNEADERGVVLGRRVAPVDDLVRSPGLAGDGVAVDLRRLAVPCSTTPSMMAVIWLAVSLRDVRRMPLRGTSCAGRPG